MYFIVIGNWSWRTYVHVGVQLSRDVWANLLGLLRLRLFVWLEWYEVEIIWILDSKIREPVNQSSSAYVRCLPRASVNFEHFVRTECELGEPGPNFTAVVLIHLTWWIWLVLCKFHFLWHACRMQLHATTRQDLKQRTIAIFLNRKPYRETKDFNDNAIRVTITNMHFFPCRMCIVRRYLLVFPFLVVMCAKTHT